MKFQNLQQQSLKTRVTLSTLVIFLVGLWSLALYASHTLREDMQRLLGEQQFTTVTYMAGGINDELNTRLNALKQVAHNLSPLMAGHPANVQGYLAERQVFQSLFNGGVLVLGLDGVAMASLPLAAQRIDLNGLDRDAIAGALKDGKTTVGRPVLGTPQQAPMFIMVSPIHDAKGRIIGALAGVTNLGAPNFLDKITQGRYGQSGVYLLAAPAHQVFITASDKRRVLRTLPKPGVNPLHDRFMQGYEGYGLLHNFRGEEELSAAKGIPAAGWFMVIELPTEEAFAPIYAMQKNMLLATVLLTLLAGGATGWMLRRQLRPMVEAAEALARRSGDNPSLQPLPIEKPDEIGQLIGGFNRLIETLALREKALKESEAFNRAILNSMVAEIAVLDPQGVILAVNEPWNRFALQNSQEQGVSVCGTGIGANYLAVCQSVAGTSNDGELDARTGIQAVLDGRLPSLNLEYPCHTADQQRWYNMSVTPLGGPSPAGVVVAHIDISEKKAQQLQLKLASQVFAQGREGIAILDPGGRIVLTNKAFSAMTGYTEAELLGQSTRILSSGRHTPEFYQAMWETIHSTNHWAGEIWDVRKDGTEFPVWLEISTLRDAQGHITNYIGNFNDLRDAKVAESRIEHLSHFDHLTGLPNLFLLTDRTEQALSMAQRSHDVVTMMMVSLDGFKAMLDTYGHNLGDQLLIEMARRLSAAVRDQDTVARPSGRDFVLILPGTTALGASHLAVSLLRLLAQPCQLEGHELAVTASIGIASYPQNGLNFDALFNAVELARHQAKNNERGTFQFYNDTMHQSVLAREKMVKALRHAIQGEQLHLVYHPLVDLQTGHISGMEALLRWQHPELGMVSPGEFIPLAEASGLIKRLGEWVLRRACSDIRGWLDKGMAVPQVAVNVSPLQFQDNDLIGQLKNALADAQVAPSMICIEVTEGALMEDVPRSEAMLKELKALGVKLSLDDFGTGYSSLSYLKRFPFDKVKIDQSFVRDITTNASDSVIVKVIISMAHGLGLKVIAEGVETEAQCEFMRTSVCDEIQGYFFSRPISAQAIEDLFSEGRQLAPHLLRQQKPQRTLLLVDDEPNILAALKRLFRREGHTILTASSGAEGLAVLARHKVDVILSDQRMPGMTGVEFLRAAKAHYPDTIRMVLSGYTELQSVTDAINEGSIYRFLTKPWDDEQLLAHVHKAFEHKELLEENLQLDIKIRTTNQELIAANRQLGEVLETTHHQIERNHTSLTIARELLQHIPLPVLGVDDDGLIVFVNAATEQLFCAAGAILGRDLADALPVLDAAARQCAEGVACEVWIGDNPHRLVWHHMGTHSASRGRMMSLTRDRSFA